MAVSAGLNLSTPKFLIKASDSSSPKIHTLKFPSLNNPWKKSTNFLPGGRVYMRPVAAAPEKISEKVAESVKNAEETCASDPTSGECVAAWDEVEELSAAASHAREKKKDVDALEDYCKDNPETDECRTYDN